MKKANFLNWGLLALVVILISACGKNNEQAGVSEQQEQNFFSEDGSFDPFPETIILNSWGGQETDKVFPPGQDWEDNIWTRGVEKTLNIKFKWEWWAPTNDFLQKFNTSLAGSNLPEFQSRIPYDVYLRLAEAGKLAPSDEALAKYGSKDLKELMHLYDDKHYKKMTVGGKLYGIAPPENNNPVMVGYIRKDWLARIGKEVPQDDYLIFAQDEFYQIVDQFINDDPDNNNVKDSRAIAISGDLFGAGFNISLLFAMGNSFPTIWIEKGGKLVYGSLTEESKQVLEKMHELNQKGAFPNEFFISNPWDIGEALVRPNLGIVLGYYWFPMWAYQTMKASANIEWTPFLLKRNDGSLVITPMSLNPGQVMVMNAGTKYPEAVVKIANFTLDNYYNNPDYTLVQDKDGNYIEPLYVPWGSASAFSHLIEIQQIVDVMPKALANNDPSLLNAKYKKVYDKLEEYQKTQNVDFIGNYGFTSPKGSFAYNVKLFRDPSLPIDKFQGVPSKSMSKNMGNLLSKRNEVFLKIITGELSVEDFDKEWVQYWDNNGGAKVDKEVNDWYAENR